MLSTIGTTRRTGRARTATFVVGTLCSASALVVGAGAAAAASAPRAALPTPRKDPKAAALVPAAIRKAGVVSFAADATYAPDEFVAANGKTIIGMDVDLGNALAAVLGLKAHFVNATFDTIIPGLVDGRFDVGLSSFTVTAAREKQVNFVSYYQAGEGFYVKSSSPANVTDLATLCGKTVAVETGTTEQADAQRDVALCKKAGKKPDTVLPFNTQDEANLAVASGRAQAGFADSQVAAYIVHQSHGTFKLSGKPFGVAPYGIAFPKSSTLDKATLVALQDLKRSGLYMKILEKWGIANGALAHFAINPKVS